MINKIKSAISDKLWTAYELDVYKENVEQGADEPCFFIYHVNTFPTAKLRSLTNNHSFTTIITVKFYAKDNAYEDVSDKAVEIPLLLETLYIDGQKVNGYDMDSTPIDDELTVTINYDFDYSEPEDLAEFINSYELDGDINED